MNVVTQSTIKKKNVFFKDDTIELLKKFRDINTPVEVSPALGFYLDITPIQNEWDLMREVWDTYGTPLVNGTVPIEGNYEKLLDEMNKAGAEKYLAEVQRQFDAWLEAKGKK